VRVTGFGGTIPPDDRIAADAARNAAGIPAGEGGMLVAYVNGLPAGSGGVTIVDGVARLWGGAVAPSAGPGGVPGGARRGWPTRWLTARRRPW
jgi:hypothetical protein